MAWSFKEYYKEHREEMLARRRKRYLTEIDYRNGRRKDALSYYNRKVKREVPLVRMILVFRGRKYYTIGKLSEMINRDVGTIRRYHYSGVLPPPTIRHKNGWRLYTEEQANLLQRLFQLLDQKEERINLKVLRDLVSRNWGNRTKQDCKRVQKQKGGTA